MAVELNDYQCDAIFDDLLSLKDSDTIDKILRVANSVHSENAIEEPSMRWMVIRYLLRPENLERLSDILSDFDFDNELDNPQQSNESEDSQDYESE